MLNGEIGRKVMFDEFYFKYIYDWKSFDRGLKKANPELYNRFIKEAKKARKANQKIKEEFREIFGKIEAKYGEK